MIFFQPFFLPSVHEVNTYIIGCKETKEALLVDAGGDSPDYDAFLQTHQAKLTGIFLTHLHWDHDGGLDDILKRFHVPVYSMTGNTPNGQSVREGHSIPLGKVKTQVCQTTGHTPNSIMLVVEKRLAFVGDALFAGSIGGTSSQAAQDEEKDNILRKIFTLPEDTLICPGHGPMTTVKIEKTANPFFQNAS
ncbi:MBL fold metallo-hydrolase [bacterium]|nr:MBL fold metallo-hydrolase [bacterium]